MGKHTAQPAKTDMPHKAVRVVRTRTHPFIVFCKHMIVESFAGFLAIIVFETNRNGWLDLFGNHTDSVNHAIQTFQLFL